MATRKKVILRIFYFYRFIVFSDYYQSKMVLESTIICVDNSQFMRNGDFHPTRLQAQQVKQNKLSIFREFKIIFRTR